MTLERRAIVGAVLGYFLRRRREQLDHRARVSEWGYRADAWTSDEVCANVSSGWRPLVRDLHQCLLALDPDYILIAVNAGNGQLRVFARFAPEVSLQCEDEVSAVRYQAHVTCEVCGDRGQPRQRAAGTKVLCPDCFAADRAAAAERGERYANIVLRCLTSDDPDFPDPDRLEEWLHKGEQGH